MAMARQKLSAESLLLSYLDQERYVLKANLPHWLLIQVPGWTDAQFLAESFQGVLTQWAQNRAPVYFQYGCSHLPYLMQLSDKGDLMDIQIEGLKVNRALLDVFGMMLSNPDRSLSLVNTFSQRQISVSGGAGGRYLLGASKEQAAQWRRTQYWMPEALVDFNRAWRQEMSPGSDLWFEWRYRIDSLAPVEGRPVATPDYELVTRYRIIEGVGGSLFHLGENLGMEKISSYV